MKRTYVRITALICALIMVAIALGGILFTFIRVNDANSEFVNKVTGSNDNFFDLSSMKIDDTDDLQKTLVVFNGMKYLAGRTDPDIGHYGRYVYEAGTSMNEGDSTDINQVYFFVEVKDVENPEHVVDVHLSNDGSYVVTEDSVLNYSIYSDNSNVKVVVTSPLITEVGLEERSNETVTEETEKQNELDIEAKAKFDEIIDEYSPYDNVSAIETGLITSHALIISSSSFELTMPGDDLDIYEYDTYIFHPLAYVLSNNIHVYILFIVMFFVLVLLTVFMMRRMYINRMNFEARTKNLTRCFAHELKTPLAVTQAYVENWELVPENERKDVSDKIAGEIDHMNKMVGTLLNLSKMDSGDVKLDLGEVELFEMAKTCAAHMEALSKERHIDVSFKKDDENGEYVVMADLDMMNMVISNFLSNAIKYGKKKVEISLQSSGKNVKFRIRNDGETISAKDQKKIWDLFYKKDNSRTDRMDSNGVGLAVNKSILELHKARFGVESGTDGTVFWFEMKKAKE